MRAKQHFQNFLELDHSLFFVQNLHGYYIKNMIERRNNKKFLKILREKTDIRRTARPLISVIIPTYNRSKLLVERAITSVLNQTYQNFEIVIVGDHCTDDTEERLKEFGDSRIRFFNLKKRTRYPENPHHRWMILGVGPRNKALELSRGEWIAPLGDDDEFSEEHLEKLLEHAQNGMFEMVYGILDMEVKPGKWVKVGSLPLRQSAICHQSVLFHSSLRFFKYDSQSWKYREPLDWNLWRRMKEAGVRIDFLDQVIGRHYVERTQLRT